MKNKILAAAVSLILVFCLAFPGEFSVYAQTEDFQENMVIENTGQGGSSDIEGEKEGLSEDSMNPDESNLEGGEENVEPDVNKDENANVNDDKTTEEGQGSDSEPSDKTIDGAAVEAENPADFADADENNMLDEEIIDFIHAAPFLSPVKGEAGLFRKAAASAAPRDSKTGLELSKTAKKNDDGSYTIRMEAYSTGESVLTTVTEDVPTDVVLVLDQSGSMGDPFNRQNPEKKIDALNKSASAFVSSVAEKAAGKDGQIGTDDDINHRIAVVGFASQSGYGNNTEILSVSGPNSGSVGIAYDQLTDRNYKDSLQSMDTGAGKAMVNNALDALRASGATRTDLGLTMAQEIFGQHPLQAGEKRNRVVILFTDGAPTDINGFQLNIANNAIASSVALKSTYGATVYSIGIFSGADATNAGSKPWNDLSNNSKSMSSACNWFMQNVSSNNGTPQDPGYYLSASNAESLNTIFEQISKQIQTGGSSTTLDENSVIKDIVTPYFNMPENADKIRTKTAEYIGKDVFGPEQNTTNLTISTNGDTVSVKGFSFKDNWCGAQAQGDETIYHGKKLIIEFEISPKEDFLGGNQVPTNGELSGIYKDQSEKDPIDVFPVPAVDVEIKPVTVSMKDCYLYLGMDKAQKLMPDFLRNGEIIKCGNVPIDFSKAGYGLQDWQHAFVKISRQMYLAEIAADSSLKWEDFMQDGVHPPYQDKDFRDIITITPTNDGTVEAQEGRDTKTICVMKPQLTWKDSAIELGEKADYENNKGADFLLWMYGGKSNQQLKEEYAQTANFFGEAPQLICVLNPDAGYFIRETPVSVKVYTGTTGDAEGSGSGGQAESIKKKEDITAYVTFVHENCDVKDCQWGEEGFSKKDCQFIVHIKPFDLIITKTGWHEIDENQSFLFEITGADGFSLMVSVQGNGQTTIKDLKAGTYTVREVTDWSWRYQNENAVHTVKPEDVKDGIYTTDFANKRSTKQDHGNQDNGWKWLNGCAFCDNRWNRDAASDR